MKKIIHIGGNLRINGISSFIMMLFRNLHNDYQFIFINTAEGKDYYRKEIENLGGKVYDVVVPGTGLLRSLRQARNIRKIIRIEKPIAVHSHYFSNNGIYLAQAFKEKVPVRIAHCHQYSSEFLSLGKKIAVFFSRLLTKKYATHKYACCENGRKFIYGKDGQTFFYSIDYEKFRLVKKDLFTDYHLNKSIRYFTFIGRFARQKNIPFLLSICKSLSTMDDVKFIFVGYGPEEQKIKDFINENSLENIIIYPPDSNIPEILSVSTALLLPSLYEGLPITLIESQAVGIPALVAEGISHELQLGLIDYLPLCLDVWTEKIMEFAKKERIIRPQKSALFDQHYAAAFFDGVYSNINSDEWIQRGKEYSIGSKRFFRSKELSVLCFKEAHRQGNARGTFYYALAYFEGNGVAKDQKKASTLVETIIEEVEREHSMRNSDYTVILADMYSFGLGKEQSFKKAFELYQQAAQQQNLEAMCDLGYMYLVGQGVSVDKEKSSFWFKKSADLGYVHSMRDIGQNYLKGDGVPQSGELAVKYFYLASQNNYSHGTTDLANCYMYGIGVENNNEKARELFKLALKQDSERAIRDLFAYGIDVKRFLDENILDFSLKTEISEINDSNSYAGVLYVTKDIEKIDPNAFYTSDIKKIFVEKDNLNYTASGGVLFNKSKDILVRYPLKSSETTYNVPKGVKIIGPHAFQNARNLRTITLPESVEIIEDSAFDDCKELNQIILPKALTYIGPWSFHGCDKIKSIDIPADVKEIQKYAFGSCENLEAINVDNANGKYCSVNGDLYSADGKTLFQYAVGKRNTSFILPSSVETIEFRAFSDAYFLEYIDLSNVRCVCEKAFYYARSLKNVRCKKGIMFGDHAFDFVHEDFTLEEW